MINNIRDRHLIVISVDALVTEDLDYLDGFPVFHEMMSNGSVIKKVRTIYPSLTHPVHASIITGRPAGDTGITENTVFTPGTDDMPWYNKYSEIKCETIFKPAKRAGLTTAVCRWPVTANDVTDIDYLVPEIMDKDMEGLEDRPLQAYINNGTSECVLDIVDEAIRKCGAELSHPVCDESENECVCEIIKRYKPNLLLSHPGFVDSERHRTGLFSSYVLKSLEKTEEWISKIVEATKEAGIYENTDFVILSDHGHCPYRYLVMPNVRLVQEGLITLDEDGNVKDWEVYVQSCDLSAHVYLKNPSDTALRNRVEKLLKQWAEEDSMGVESYMSTEEVDRQYGLRGDFSYVIEARADYAFKDNFTGELIMEKPPVEEDLGHSGHGHLPHKGPQPVFIGYGPHFTAGEVKETGSILEHIDTFKRVLGI